MLDEHDGGDRESIRVKGVVGLRHGNNENCKRRNVFRKRRLLYNNERQDLHQLWLELVI